MSVDLWEHAARAFEPAVRRWATPGAMARDLRLSRADKTSPALDLIHDELVALTDGPGDRLMIFMAPQEGKSQSVSRCYPLWLLSRDPTLRIAIVSYQSGKAERWGREIRRDLLDHPTLGIQLRADSRAAGRWETIQGGGLVCAGIEGGITGEPVDVLIIDDPVRGRAEAESLTYRDAAWEWWESNGSTRLSERGVVILMNTRWHEDDLAGRMLTREPGRWKVLSIPAIAVNDDDPLGRAPGEELPSVRGRQPGYFHDLKAVRSPYVFSSIYQQSPVPAEGGLFKRDRLKYWRYAVDNDLGKAIELHRRVWLRDLWVFATVDLASSTKTSADWSVISIWGVTNDDHLVLLDRGRARMDETRHWNIAAPLIQKWAPEFVGVEDAKKSMTLVSDLTRHHVPWKPLNPDTDKITRAIPASNRVQDGRLWLPAEASWLDEFVDELAGFPNAAHDDQVDTLAYAALELARGRQISGVVSIPARPLERVDADLAPTPDLDLMAEAY